MGKVIPFVIVILAAVLGWGAIEFIPGTLFFPVVNYSTPENVRFAVLKTGETTSQRCQQTLKQLSASIRAACPACTSVELCYQGLDGERKTILSREPLGIPSARSAAITITVSAPDAAVGQAVCELMEKQSATQPVAARLRCYPAFVNRVP